MKKKIIRAMEDNRGLILTVFGLPLSFLFDQVMQFRNWWYRVFLSSPSKHMDRVAQIQAQVKLNMAKPKDQRKTMCTARPNWLSLSTTFFNKGACHKVPIPLYDVLALDEERLVVRVEPMVSVGDVTRYLVPQTCCHLHRASVNQRPVAPTRAQTGNVLHLSTGGR